MTTAERIKSELMQGRSTTAVICAATGLSHTAVESALRRMLRIGVVRRVGWGLYELSELSVSGKTTMTDIMLRDE